MSSLVSELTINPVLRQARRISETSRSATAEDSHGDQATPAHVRNRAVIEDSDATDEPLAPADAMSSEIRPMSASTQDDTIVEPTTPPNAPNDLSHDHLGFPLSPIRKGRLLPEDDGMGYLRRRILTIQALDLPPEDKARLMHDVMNGGYRLLPSASPAAAPKVSNAEDLAWKHAASQGTLDSLRFWNQVEGPEERFVVTAVDIAPTFAPIRKPKSPQSGTAPPSPALSASSESPITPDRPPPLGCEHYERNVKLQCFTCEKWYTCRFCHDTKEDHSLIRMETRNMLCMLCATPQKASDMCISCGQVAAHYYCNICKLWENRQSKPIYHCNDCGICRRGLGLGKDFFHCKTCRACITTSIESSHKCIERSTDCDCPICGEYMFTSPKPVVFMACGHSIHKRCYDQHMKVSYKCPICNKSLANMETQFRNLDVAIQSQPMPPEFRDTKAVVLCNDCSAKSIVPYHWLGLKCSICRSYNTVEMHILGGDAEDLLQNAPIDRIVPVVASASHAEADMPVHRPSITRPQRRRHSSHTIEPQHQHLDRTARSMSPIGLPGELLAALGTAVSDSEDDMLGLWRAGGGDTTTSSEYEDDSDEDSDEGLDDEDDEDDIVLIGHR